MNILFIIISISVLIILMNYLFKYNSKSDNITLWNKDEPYSVDPNDFDFLAHHIFFSSVFSPLVSEYQIGDIKGVIAKSWEASPDFTLWKFKIRDNLTFENGDPITPEIVYKSLQRIGYLLHLRKSRNGLFEFLKDFDKIENINTSFQGLRLEGKEIIFDFSKPIKNMLSLISFGMYSIVHPSLFNETTGEWKDKKKAIASGAYRISKWDSDQLILERRSNYESTFQINDKSFRSPSKITIHWDPKYKHESDLVFGTSDEDLVSENREFFGGVTSELRFIRCVSWHVKGSPCYDVNDRKILRNSFYSNLRKLGFNPTNSFFPLEMQGIKEIPFTQEAVVEKKFNKDLRVNNTTANNPIVKKGYGPALESVAKEFALDISFITMKFEDLMTEVVERPAKTTVDISTNASGFYIDKPLDDIQFMFKSKDGVAIPDTDGRIMAELENDNFDPQKINELIWDQAAVWPLLQYARGFWATKNKFDFSQINLVRTPTLFELIGLK